MTGKKYKFEYMIYSCPDEENFKRQCKALEEGITGLVKGNLLPDVDGSDYQCYTLDDANIVVANDYFMDGIFVYSDIELRPFFQK